METQFNLSGTISTPQDTNLESPFKEVRQAAEFLRMLLGIPGVPYDYLQFEELLTPKAIGRDGAYRISFSYTLKDNHNWLCPTRIRNTVVFENNQIVKMYNGSVSEE